MSRIFFQAWEKSMVGAVIITHGTLADGLLKAARSITGKVGGVKVIGIKRGDSTEEVRATLEQAIREVNEGAGVVVFTDMFGGTPTNIALSFLDEDGVEVLTGVNLPMLLKFLGNRTGKPVIELAEALKECGHQSIVQVSKMLKMERKAK